MLTTGRSLFILFPMFLIAMCSRYPFVAESSGDEPPLPWFVCIDQRVAMIGLDRSDLPSRFYFIDFYEPTILDGDAHLTGKIEVYGDGVKGNFDNLEFRRIEEDQVLHWKPVDVWEVIDWDSVRSKIVPSTESIGDIYRVSTPRFDCLNLSKPERLFVFLDGELILDGWSSVPVIEQQVGGKKTRSTYEEQLAYLVRNVVLTPHDPKLVSPLLTSLDKTQIGATTELKGQVVLLTRYNSSTLDFVRFTVVRERGFTPGLLQVRFSDTEVQRIMSVATPVRRTLDDVKDYYDRKCPAHSKHVRK